MRFLLHCVACYRTATETPPPPSPEISSAKAEEETRSLVRRGSRLRRSKRGAGEWRPSLFPISEDNIVPPRKAEEKGRTAPAPVNGRRCTGSSVRVCVHGRGDFGREVIPMMVPAFSPTPFIF